MRTLPSLLAGLAVLGLAACGPRTFRSTAPPGGPGSLIRELWIEPTDLTNRDLFYGVGGERLSPRPDERWGYVAQDLTGFSRGFDVRDTRGREWSVKVGLEARTEVVASRLAWAIGFHQPAMYYVHHWDLVGGEMAGPQYGGRFRIDDGYRKADNWSWHRNPFVGTAPFRGLLVFNLLVNNWDLIGRNNVIYEAETNTASPPRLFVVRDLGGSFGKSRWFPQGTRNDLDGFEQETFIAGVDTDGRVRFGYRGRHRELLRDLRVADVRWTCERLSRLTERQWRDAFRAAQYPDDRAARYIKTVRARVAQGLNLTAGGEVHARRQQPRRQQQ